MKTITIKSNGTGRYDDVSPFIMTDNKLELQIELPNVNGEFYLVSQNNGKTEKKLLSITGIVTLENLTAGELQAEVKHYLKGTLIKSYQIEPLILKEVDGKLSGTPEIAALRRELDELKEQREKDARAAAEREKKLKDLIYALLRFAVTDYLNNVYLGGTSEKEFFEKFNFNLTPDEIKFILGVKKDDED